MSESRSARFRELLRKPPFVCLGAHDAVTAKLAEQAGAPAIYVSGFVASAIVAGQPDFGVLTQTEMFEHIRRICRVTTVPVFADADTGYGGPLDAQRTIQLWEEAGASVLHLEDQAMPKKCGHFAGKELIPAEEMRHKLRAMLEARRDPDFFVVARTDAMGVTDLVSRNDICVGFGQAIQDMDKSWFAAEGPRFPQDSAVKVLVRVLLYRRFHGVFPDTLDIDWRQFVVGLIKPPSSGLVNGTVRPAFYIMSEVTFGIDFCTVRIIFHDATLRLRYWIKQSRNRLAQRR